MDGRWNFRRSELNGLTLTTRSDIAKAMYIGTKEVFMEEFKETTYRSNGKHTLLLKIQTRWKKLMIQ